MPKVCINSVRTGGHLLATVNVLEIVDRHGQWKISYSYMRLTKKMKGKQSTRMLGSYSAVQNIFDGFWSMRLCFQSHYSSPFFACFVYFAMKKCTQTKHEFLLIRMSHLVLSCEFLEWPFPDVCWTHTFPMNCVHLTENSFLVHVS